MKSNLEHRNEALLSRIKNEINSFGNLVISDKFTIREKYKLNSGYLVIVLSLSLFIYFTFIDYQIIISFLYGLLSLILCVGVILHYLNSKYNYTQFDFQNKRILYKHNFFHQKRELTLNEESDIKFNIEEIGSGIHRYYNMQLHIDNQLILDCGNRYESNCEILKKALLKLFRTFYEMKILDQ